SLLNRPTLANDLDKICRALFPLRNFRVDEVITDCLQPRSLVTYDPATTVLQVEHSLISEFARGKWADLAEAHRVVAGFYLNRANQVTQGKSLSGQEHADLLVAYEHCLEAVDRPTANRI